MTDALAHDDQAEQALLGAMLISAAAIAQAITLITPDQLYRPYNQLIWYTITGAPEWGDPTIIASILLQTGQITKIPGGANYLHDCIRTCPNPANITYYARAITTTALTRTRRELLARLSHALDQPDPAAWDAAWTYVQTHQQPAQANANGHNPIRLTPASSFAIAPVRWLWDGRMPQGEITLIPGREGVGKSVLMAWLAAAVTNGNLPGRHHGTPRAVLYAATEDSWAHGIAPRLLAAGARLDMVYRVDVVDPDTDEHRGLILPRDTTYLPERAREVGAALLICDPIISMVDEKINSFKAQELRKALEPLKDATEQAGLAAACLVHFNKTIGDIMTMISGSRAWGEVARASIAVARDDDADEVTNIVSQVKNNLGRLDLPNLTYTIDDVRIETSFGEDAHPGRLRWTGETDTTAADLLSGHTTDRTYSDTTLAILEFVKDMGVAVTVPDVAEHFKDTMRYDAVKRALARCAKRGDLVSPRRGHYELAPKKGARRSR